MTVIESAIESFLDEAWEDYGDGWTYDGPVSPNTSLNGLQRRVEYVSWDSAAWWWGELGDAWEDLDQPDGNLEFDSSSLTGKLSTATPTGVTVRPMQCYVEAFAVGEQISPVTWDDAVGRFGESAPWSWEGAISDDADKCTLKIKWKRTLDNVTWTDWEDYSPCTAHLASARFRLVVTRPDNSYQVRVERFHTRMTKIPDKRGERTEQQFALENKLYG
jgi:hypothetical protein